MKEPAESDPYQPPASFDSISPESKGPAVLRDPSVMGNAALASISLQVLVKFFMAFGPRERDWLIALTIAHVVVYLASVVFFLIWLYRCAVNVLRVNRHADVRPGWAVGSYFIPVLNWVAPIVTMRAIIRGTFVRKTPGALPSIAVAWWSAFVISNGVLRVSQDPVMFGVWALAIVVSWISVMVLVTRISRCQAEFRWADGPHSQRVMMTPLPPRGTSGQPAVEVRQIPQTTRESAAVPDIESEWGRG